MTAGGIHGQGIKRFHTLASITEHQISHLLWLEMVSAIINHLLISTLRLELEQEGW